MTKEIKNPITPDEIRLQNTIEEDRKQLALERRRQYIESTMQNSPVISGDGVCLADPTQQVGRALTPRQLEQKLIKLCPQLHFVVNPNNPLKKALYLRLPQGELEYLCAYENSLMPEHSVMRVLIHEYPDPDYFAGQVVMERDAVPDYEKVNDAESPFGFSYKFDPAARRPGFLYIEKGFGEEKRGWRTVLLRLIMRNLLSVEQAEREFGSDNRVEWASHTAKRSEAVPTW